MLEITKALLKTNSADKVMQMLMNAGQDSLAAAQLICEALEAPKTTEPKPIKKQFKPLNRDKAPRRDVLYRRAQAGQLEAKCNYHLTDDYRFDDANDFGKTDWLEINIIENNDQFKSGLMNLRQWDFQTSTGCTWWNEDGTITLSVHSNLSYTLREVA